MFVISTNTRIFSIVCYATIYISRKSTRLEPSLAVVCLRRRLCGKCFLLRLFYFPFSSDFTNNSAVSQRAVPWRWARLRVRVFRIFLATHRQQLLPNCARSSHGIAVRVLGTSTTKHDARREHFARQFVILARWRRVIGWWVGNG